MEKILQKIEENDFMLSELDLRDSFKAEDFIRFLRKNNKTVDIYDFEKNCRITLYASKDKIEFRKDYECFLEKDK